MNRMTQAYTRWQIQFHTVLPWLNGLVYLDGALVLGGKFLYCAVRLMNPSGEAYAMQVSIDPLPDGLVRLVARRSLPDAFARSGGAHAV